METLTVKFEGQNHQVDVQTFANSVLNFATVIKETNRIQGGEPISINIKAPEKGSLIVQLVASMVSSTSSLLNPENISYISDVVCIVGGLYAFHKATSGKKVVGKEKENNFIKIQFDDHSEFNVAENVYNIYVNALAVSNGISQNFAALEEDPAVSKFEVSKDQKRIIEVDREDFPRLAIKQQFDTENTRKTIESASLHIYKVVFEKTDRKWEFYYKGNRISASISDEDFYKKIDNGESFAKGDQLKVDLQINQILDESVGIYVNQSYQVMKVHEHIKREKPPELPFNKEISA
jgi:hypothetical protein